MRRVLSVAAVALVSTLLLSALVTYIRISNLNAYGAGMQHATCSWLSYDAETNPRVAPEFHQKLEQWGCIN